MPSYFVATVSIKTRLKKILTICVQSVGNLSWGLLLDLNFSMALIRHGFTEWLSISLGLIAVKV